MYAFVKIVSGVLVSAFLVVSWLGFLALAPAVLTSMRAFPGWSHFLALPAPVLAPTATAEAMIVIIVPFASQTPSPDVQTPIVLTPTATPLALLGLPQAMPTVATVTPIPPPSLPSVVCQVETFYDDTNANLRRGPSMGYGVQTVLRPGETANVIGQSKGTDGFIWWRLENLLWVREDVVRELGNCRLAPFQ